MSWNFTPIWCLCNPYKIPNQDGFYYFPPNPTADRVGPFETYQEALEALLAAGGKQGGEEDWLE